MMLLAGGGPAAPDSSVLLASTMPIIGQFDPAFTAIMDDVMVLARGVLLTENERCFAVSGLAGAGLEAMLNSLLEVGDRVSIGGGQRFVADTTRMARRYGARVGSLDDLGDDVKLVVVPFIDPQLGQLAHVADLANMAHAHGARLLVDATLGLGAVELRVDAWQIDACVAGADYAIGAPSGMALVTYSAEVEAMLQARQTAPQTSYLDLLQLQAYWGPERLNHHTAPTSLIYGLREALRAILAQGLDQCWQRHAACGGALREGLRALNLEVTGDGPYAYVHFPAEVDADSLREQLRTAYGIHVRPIGPHAWRVGLLGADARADGVQRLLTSVEGVLSVA